MRVPMASLPPALRRAALAAALAGVLGGCVLAVGGAALGGAIVATDRRSVGIQIEDAEIEHRINKALDDRFARQSVRIDVSAYDQKVLLAGQVPGDKDRSDAEALATATLNVHQVVNELTIGSLSGLSSGTDDALLAGKVRSALLDVHGLVAGAVKVTCTDGSIFLLGRVDAGEAALAERAASHINGVKRVVALFEILTDAEMAQYRHSDGAAPPPSAAK